MFDFLLSTGAQTTEAALTSNAKSVFGGEVTMLGLGTVLVVLVLLWGLVKLLHFRLSAFSGEKTEKATKATAVSAQEPTTVSSEPLSSTAVSIASDDLAIVAVITAAIAASEGTDPSTFRVVSFKRANNKFSYGK